MEERHLIIVSLGQEMMHLLFLEGATLRCMAGIPPDARFLGVHANFATCSFEAMFEHSSFPRCPPGTVAQRRPVCWEVIEHPQADLIDGYPRYIGNPDKTEYIRTERGKRTWGES